MAINANAANVELTAFHNPTITAVYDPNSNFTMPWSNTNTTQTVSSLDKMIIEDKNCYPVPRKTYEFKLVDGTKVIQDLNYDDIIELKEVELRSSDDKTRKVIHLTLNNIKGNTTTKRLEIDCNLSMFMKIIGHTYKPWAKSLMEESVKNGSETN